MKNCVIFFLLLTSSIYVSCKKSTTHAKLNKHSITNVSDEETDPDEIRFNKVIEAVTYGLLDLRSNSTFRSIVNSQVDLQFDTDDDIFLKTLDSVCIANDINLQNEMLSSLNSHNKAELSDYLYEAIHGFYYGLDEYGDSITLYPQIYIPSADSVTRTGIPTIAENFHEETGVVMGINSDEDIAEVDEVYAADNLTWVVGINEVVNNQGKVTVQTSATQTTSTGDNTILIVRVEVTDHKEGFPNGKSELAYTLYRKGANCNVGGYRQEVHLAQVPHWQLVMNLPAVNETRIAPLSDPFSPTSTYNENIYCLYYERDIRKKFAKTEEVISGCSNTTITYRSKQSKWGIQSHENEWITNWAYGFDQYRANGLTGLRIWEKWE